VRASFFDAGRAAFPAGFFATCSSACDAAFLPLALSPPARA
jgi:hypothetical protein